MDVLLQLAADLPGGTSGASRAALQSKTSEALALVEHSVVWATRAGSGCVQPLLRISKGRTAFRKVSSKVPLCSRYS